MSKVVLSPIQSGFALSKINDNFTKLQNELNNKVLYRDNPVGEPNAFTSDLDLDGNSIYNVDDLIVNGELTVGGVNLATQIGLAEMFANQSKGYRDESQGYAVDSATSAGQSATSAAQSTISASNSLSAANVSEGIAASLAGGTIGFDAVAYDFGSVADPTTYFNRDFGSVTN